MQAVFRDRNEPTAEASFAAIFERSKLGMAIAAMIKMIATTIKSSINEKPFCFLRITSSPGFQVRTEIRSIRSKHDTNSNTDQLQFELDRKSTRLNSSHGYIS